MWGGGGGLPSFSGSIIKKTIAILLIYQHQPEDAGSVWLKLIYIFKIKCPSAPSFQLIHLAPGHHRPHYLHQSLHDVIQLPDLLAK